MLRNGRIPLRKLPKIMRRVIKPGDLVAFCQWIMRLPWQIWFTVWIEFADVCCWLIINTSYKLTSSIFLCECSINTLQWCVRLMRSYNHISVYIGTYNLLTFWLRSQYFYKCWNGVTTLVSCFPTPTHVLYSVDWFEVLKKPKTALMEVPQGI